jgi:hypothetical protein
MFARCDITAPFGRPVVPLVYIMYSGSSIERGADGRFARRGAGHGRVCLARLEVDPADVRELLAQRLDQWGEVGAVQHGRRAAVRELVGEFGHREPPVERDEHEARLGAREVSRGMQRRVAHQHADPIARCQAAGEQHVRELVGARVGLGEAQTLARIRVDPRFEPRADLGAFGQHLSAVQQHTCSPLPERAKLAASGQERQLAVRWEAESRLGKTDRESRRERLPLPVDG